MLLRWGRFHVLTWLSTFLAIVCFALYTVALALPRWSHQSSATVVVLGSGDAYYGPFEICVQSANVWTCAFVTDSITGGVSTQSLCDAYSSYAYCTKSVGVEAMMVLAIAACAFCAILIGYHQVQMLLHAAAAAFGLVAMALWLNLQMAMNNDAASSSSFSPDFCEGLVIFSWLANATAVLLTIWGNRNPVAPGITVSASLA